MSFYLHGYLYCIINKFCDSLSKINPWMKYDQSKFNLKKIQRSIFIIFPLRKKL